MAAMRDSEIVSRVHADDTLKLGELDTIVLFRLHQLLRHPVLRFSEVEHLDVILGIAEEALQVVRVWNCESMLQAWFLAPGTGWPPWRGSAHGTGALTFDG